MSKFTRPQAGDTRIAIGVRKGQCQVQRITYTKRGSIVEPLSGWMTLAQAQEFKAGVQS